MPEQHRTNPTPIVLASASTRRKELLEQIGYRIVTAPHGRAALALVAEHDDLAAMITDLSMPEMDGLTTIRALRARGLTLPIIASSGLGTDRAEAALEAGADVFLAKPYTAERLSTTLYDVLHREPTTK